MASINETRNQAMIDIETGATNANQIIDKLAAIETDLEHLRDILTGMLHAARRMHQVDLAEIRYLDAQANIYALNLRLSMEAHPSNYRWDAR